MNNYIFDNFLEDSWDFVSEKIITDKYYFENIDFLREITFSIYQIYLKREKLVDEESQMNSAKEAGLLLETFLSTLLKYKPN